MIRRSPSPALLAMFILAGCGGQSDTPASRTMSTAVVVAADGQPQLGAPISNLAAQATQAKQPAALQRTAARMAADAAITVDVNDRDAVRLLFNQVYNAPAVAMGWTGNHAGGVAGTTSAQFKAATLTRLNWYRAMAGVPASVPLSETNSAKAQQAALMMSVAGQLSHTPTSNWRFYTPQGAEAAQSSNLALGGTGPVAIEQYMRDDGSNNGAVGHRRWILHPNTRTVGTGDVPAGTMEGRQLMGANALWTTDVDFAAPRAPVRDEFVAWPAKGYAPYATVFQRWSFSYPDADFSQARVTLTRDGVTLAASLEAVANGYGENTLVWKVPGIDAARSHAKPAADVRYRVSIANVRVAQRLRSFDYDVTVFDPAVATPGAAVPVLSAPAQAVAGQAFAARIAAIPGASSYSVSAAPMTALTGTRPTPFDSATWIGANGGTHAIVDGGKLRFYVTGSEWGVQSATLGKPLFVGSAAGKVLVTRTMGWATGAQAFRVQASLDGGKNWIDLYAETGRESAPGPTGTVPVSLAAYAGKSIRLRLASDVNGSAYTGPDTGWSVTGITFEDVHALGAPNFTTSSSGEFTLSLATPGNWMLVPGARLGGTVDADPGVPVLVKVD